ncbi:hypothetical protein [Streptomyces sp. NPDC097610]|uniref:hypothetical protein n=1 Tax=Streptomyces sp. NPDC097610 TaxID=3157227 RepID=UPI003317A40F
MLILVASALAGNVFLVTGFVAASPLSPAMAHRRRNTALLRAVWATPGQILRTVTAEAPAVTFL